MGLVVETAEAEEEPGRCGALLLGFKTLRVCWGGCGVFCLDGGLLLATVWRIVSCGVLAGQELCGIEGKAGLLLRPPLRSEETACHGDTVGGAGCGFSVPVGVLGCPSC